MKDKKCARKFKIIGWLVIIIVVVAIVIAGVWIYKGKKVSTWIQPKSISPKELTAEEKQYLDQNIEKIKTYFEQKNAK